jgi:hypothetical protein
MTRAKGKKSAPKRTREARSNLRFDDLTVFARDLVCSQKGWSHTKAAEEGIHLLAAQLDLGQREGAKWSELYDPHPGVVKLKLLSLPRYIVSAADEALKTFVFTHREFFYTETPRGEAVPHREYVVHLWPELDRYRALWRERLHEDYWCARKAMAGDLKRQGIPPPKPREDA